jgi:hypothetical protein
MKRLFIITLIFSLAAATGAQKPAIDLKKPVSPIDWQHSTDLSKATVDLNFRLEPTEIQKLQARHTRVLRYFGVTDLTQTGKLSLSGNVVPKAGFLAPPAAVIDWTTTPATLPNASQFARVAPPPSIYEGTTTIRAATHVAGGNAQRTFVPLIGNAQLLTAKPFPVQSGKTADANDFPVDTAYLAAQWIDFAPGTNFIVKFPIKKIILITTKATFGADVTFTYERETPSLASVPPKPGKPGTPSIPASFSKGNAGGRGTDGGNGAPGPGKFSDAPTFEVWALDIQGSPAVDARGQDGYPGGKGGDGGDGGNGSDGSASDIRYVLGAAVDCRSGPGDGGDGGSGGKAGNGGGGGDGSKGGQFILYAPAPVIAAYGSGGFYVSVDPGAGGPGGAPGLPGDGGSGGSPGTWHKPCSGGQPSGSAGGRGAVGLPGAAGNLGTKASDKPIRFTSITKDEFTTEWEKPAITKLTSTTSPQGRAVEGEVVSVAGERFILGDVIDIGDGNTWTACQTTVAADVLMKFTVPMVAGGVRSIRVRQPNGVVSNTASIYILPTLLKTLPPTRITPGEKVKLIGTGFAPNDRVRINNFDIGAATFINPHELEVFVIRPVSGIESNPSGERVKLGVDLAGTRSNDIDVVLDTYLIVDIGDSIIAGPGLAEDERIPSLVAKALKNQPGNRSVYQRSLSHTGAKIGLNPLDSPGLPPVDRQVPTRYPTINEQVLNYAKAPDGAVEDIDLIVADGCANDVGFFEWMNPETSTAQIKAHVQQACHDDMLSLLRVVATKFPKAKVVVAGNYAPIGPLSSQKMLVPIMIALNNVWYAIPPHLLTGVLAPGTRDRLVANCRTFADEANKALAASVADINNQFAPPKRFFFADPKFGPENAAESGPSSWVYGVNFLTGNVVAPQDAPQVAAARAANCNAVGKPGTDIDLCRRASAGHPNAEGARRYAKAIVDALP